MHVTSHTCERYQRQPGHNAKPPDHVQPADVAVAPIHWRPASVGELKLVACIAAEEVRKAIQTCRYEGPDIIRYTAERRLLVVEVATGRRLSDEVVRVSPRQCEPTERRSLTELVDQFDWEELDAYLAPYVEGRR